MCAHTLRHRNGDFIKISRQNGPPYSLRPEEHYANEKTEAYQVQGDSSPYELLNPEDYNCVDGSLYCRSCTDYGLRFFGDDGERLGMGIISRRATLLRNHELKCSC